MIDSKLETLITLCGVKNYTKTADLMSLTQPAVSHQIKLLEAEYGIEIFKRNGKKLIITQEGKVLLKYAMRIQSLYQNLKQSIVESKKNMRRISVGITHSAASSIIPEVLAVYSSKKEDVTINILVDDINIIYANLKNYKIDLAIIDGITNSDKINSILLDTDYLVCVVSNSHPLAKKAVVQIDDLRHEKLILRSPSSGTRNLFETAIEGHNMSLSEFNIILQVDNVSTIKNLISKNIGISILPRSTCSKDINQGSLTALPVENLSMIRETRIAYLKDFTHFDIIQDIKAQYNEMNDIKSK